VIQAWSTPTVIEAGGIYPHMVVEPNGTVDVAFNLYTGDVPLVHFRRSGDGGASFAGPISLGPGYYPEISVATGGNIYLVWENSALYFSRSTDGGSTFSSPPTTVSSSGVAPQILVDSQGNSDIVWANGTILFSRSTDGGTKFSAPMPLSSSAVVADNPEMAVTSDGSITVIWQQGSGVQCDVWFSHSGDGVAFSKPVNLSNSSGCATIDQYHANHANHRQMAVEAGDKIDVVWNDSVAGVMFRRSSDGGVNFLPPANISPTLGQSPKIAVDLNGNVNVVWEGRPATNLSRVYFSRLNSSAATFSTPTIIDTNGSDTSASYLTGGTDPEVTVDSSGGIDIVWDDNTPANNPYVGSDVFFSQSVNGGALFSKPLDISNRLGVQFGGPLQIGVDSSGNVYVAWSGDVNGSDFPSLRFTKGTH
jgi:hypothetical protein